MNTERHNSIRNNLEIKPTEELLQIWQDEEDFSWEEIVYEFIEQILQERLGEVPPRTKKRHAQDVLTKSKAAFDRGDSDTALTLCKEALEINPDLAMAYQMRGMIYEEMENLDLALGNYRKAAKLDPRLQEAEDSARDIEIYLQSLDETDEFSEQLDHAVNLASEKRFEEALAICNNILAEHPNLATAYNDRGVIYDEMGEKEKALADYQKAFQLDPTNEDARDNLTSLSQELEIQFEESELKAQLDTILEYIYEEETETAYGLCLHIKADLPALAIAHNYYGLLMEFMGYYQEAMDAYQQAVTINPGFSAGFDNLRNAGEKLENEIYHRAGLTNITCDPADVEMKFSVEDGQTEDENLIEDLPGWFYLDEQAYMLKGWAGYRHLHSISGMDPLQNEFENGRMQGVIISSLFKGKFRTDNPFFLLMMLFISGIMTCPILLLFSIPTNGLELLPVLLPTIPYVFVGLVLLWDVFYSLFNEGTG